MRDETLIVSPKRVFLVDTQGEQVPLDVVTEIGRDEKNDLVLKSPSVSRLHARIINMNGVLEVTDLNSSNGTFINGRRVTGSDKAEHGDLISFESVEYRVEVEESVASTDKEEGTSDDGTRIISASVHAEPEPEPAVESVGNASESQSGKSVQQLPEEWQKKDATAFYSKEDLEAILSTIDESSAVASEDESCLIGVAGVMEGKTIPLNFENDETKVWNLGRDSDAEIVINDESVSLRHAQLIKEGRRWKIVNQLAVNGIAINGVTRLSAFLSHGDVIQLGTVALKFNLSESAKESEPSASRENERAAQNESNTLGDIFSTHWAKALAAMLFCLVLFLIVALFF